MSRTLTPDDCTEEISKEEFDLHAVDGNFTVGPFKEDQPTGYGSPYIAPLWLFGELNDGRKVRAKRY